MKNENIQIRHVVGHSLNLVFPLTMVYMCYIILHGHLSPGGGFQGGVLMVALIALVYMGHGYQVTIDAFSYHILHTSEGLASIFYVALGLLGVAMGAQFAQNVLYTHGAIGDLYSSGTIFWMNVTVGIKVLTGVGSIALLMIGVANEKEVK